MKGAIILSLGFKMLKSRCASGKNKQNKQQANPILITRTDANGVVMFYLFERDTNQCRVQEGVRAAYEMKTSLRQVVPPRAIQVCMRERPQLTPRVYQLL